MKTLFLLASLSLPAFALDDAIQTFARILRNDTFEGINELGEECVVDVFGNTSDTLVELESFGITRFRLLRAAPFSADLATRTFSSSLVTSLGDTQTEVTLSTRPEGGRLRVAIQRVRRANGQQWTSVQECRI
jgi:hypothetical protein